MKTALLFGSSGLIGGHLLNALIQNNDYNKIKIFVRSEPEIKNLKYEEVSVKKSKLLLDFGVFGLKIVDFIVFWTVLRLSDSFWCVLALQTLLKLSSKF